MDAHKDNVVISPVKISYVWDPSYFYIREATEHAEQFYQALLIRLNIAYKGSCFDPKIDIIEGMIYAFYNRTDKKWHRCEVLRIIGNHFCKVLMVDIGKKEPVAIIDLRLLSDQFSKIPNFATKCYLKNIMPVGSDTEWSKPAEAFLKNFVVFKKILYVKIQEVDCFEGLYLGVTLYELAFEDSRSLGADNEILNNLNEMLVCQGQALTSSRSSVLKPDVGMFTKKKLKYVECDIPQMNEICVRPSHLAQPDEAFVRLTLVYFDMQRIIRELRFKTPNYELGFPNVKYFPGQACVAKFDFDGKWYRAEIMSISDSGKIKVMFVDYGNQMLISDPEKCMYPDVVRHNIHKQVFKVIIDQDISHDWRKNYLEKPCKMFVMERPEDSSPMKVKLFAPERYCMNY